ncbi:hypothetical protein C453_11291 [Haloferax elongans ATCC BAA-1513]|uniref:Lipoprotein n=1 Tax=Haloferax elongans ATCC BAA-1513 TaxID=1230453 RepID=M0HJ81_HALEO|nr:hypothetical protein [Haloferax elongans]ELZ84595.1 hypothetical protein C453_11291 [Haloferax elongans ATCC BAA-1513]
MNYITRRSTLRACGIAALSSLAGCSTLSRGGSDTELPSYERLDVTPVYVADGADLTTPTEIETVTATSNADLLVLPDDTDTDAEQAVEWLIEDRVIALLGERAETTWLSWAQSDAFTDVFGAEGHADSEPDPSLVVSAKIDLRTTTSRYSWGSEPSNRDVLNALDESLVAIENKSSAE